MPTLELVIDATGMQRGAQQAETALKGVTTTAEKTATSVQSTGRALNNAFQTTSGVSQIGQGIAQTAAAFGQLNLAAGAFSASRTLLEIGKTVQDFQQMRAGITGASGAMATFGAVLRAHPLLTIATVIGAAASVMALFGSNTKKTAGAFDDLAASMNKARLDEETRAFLGAERGSPQDEMRRLYDVAFQLRREGPGTRTQPRTFSLADVQEMVGASSRGGLATEFGVSSPPREVPGFENFDLGAVQIPQEDVLNWVRQRYQRLARPSSSGGAWNRSLGGDADPLGSGAYGSGSITGGDMALREQLAKDSEMAARQIAESMAQAAAYAASIGASLGAGVFDVLAGIQSWRQALANLVNSIARQGLTDIGSSLGASLFKPTPAQTSGGQSPNLVLPPGT